MFVLLSPAKRLNEGPAVDGTGNTQPVFLEDASVLVGKARGFSAPRLGELLKISDSLAELNVARFKTWGLPFQEENARQAVLSFAGDTYVGLDATTLDDKDLEYAQDHLGILSGLYGLLRPLDLIQPYRLEMGTRLKTRRGTSLYAFWGERITDEINARIAQEETPVVINLASNEYFKSVQTTTLAGRLITPVFKEVKKGEARVVGFAAKKARGMMARYILQNRLTEIKSLEAFNEGGYQYQKALSNEDTLVFTRPSTTA